MKKISKIKTLSYYKCGRNPTCDGDQRNPRKCHIDTQLSTPIHVNEATLKNNKALEIDWKLL